MPQVRKNGEFGYLGIDPGASGALAVVCTNCHAVRKMPDTEQETWQWFEDFGPLESEDGFAVIEKVHSMPGQGVASTFKFGLSYGFLRGCLTAAGIPFEEVTPQRWQKGMGIVPRGKDESKTEFKNRLKQKASQLYPGENVTLATADALLIATWCQRWREGCL